MFSPDYVVTLGASGVIFGYFGFLKLHGLFACSISAIFISLTVCFLYGGIILGILPSSPSVSWQSHLFGFIGEVLAASLRHNQGKGNKGN